MLSYSYKSWSPALAKARALKKTGCKVTLKAIGKARVVKNGARGDLVDMRGSDQVDIDRSTDKTVRFVRYGAVARVLDALGPVVMYKRKANGKTYTVKPVSGRTGFTVKCTE